MVDYTIYRELVYKIIGASMIVHIELRYGLLEKVYEEALSIELEDIGVKHETQSKLPVYYKGRRLNKEYKMDIVAGDIVCELKSSSNISPEHRAQICNYLRLTQKPVGLLINFGKKKLEGERWVYDQSSNDCFLVDINMRPLSMQGIEINSSE